MKPSDNNADLKQRFHALRAEEKEGTPTFAPLWERAHARRNLRHRSCHRSKLLPAVAVGVAAVLVVLVVLPTHDDSDEEAELLALPITTWRAPSDFLLHSSVNRLLETIPEIGTDRQGLIEPSRILKLSGKRRPSP